MNQFEIDPELSLTTKLYRYITLEQFMFFIERKQIAVTNVNLWDDKWEVILSKIPTVGEYGRPIEQLYSFHKRIYGQCWSLAKESDAMWRIYSSSRTGIQISTSVEKFNLISEVKRSYLGKVIYFDEIKDILTESKSHQNPLRGALYKRAAFDHEREVRFLTHGDFLGHFEPELMHIGLSIDPFEFIEGITIDPRADDWYVDTIKNYCTRIGLKIEPIKSSLYETDPHLKLGLVKVYKAVGSKRLGRP